MALVALSRLAASASNMPRLTAGESAKSSAQRQNSNARGEVFDMSSVRAGPIIAAIVRARICYMALQGAPSKNPNRLVHFNRACTKVV
jgi:hypothetical protein